FNGHNACHVIPHDKLQYLTIVEQTGKEEEEDSSEEMQTKRTYKRRHSSISISDTPNYLAGSDIDDDVYFEPGKIRDIPRTVRNVESRDDYDDTDVLAYSSCYDPLTPENPHDELCRVIQSAGISKTAYDKLRAVLIKKYHLPASTPDSKELNEARERSFPVLPMVRKDYHYFPISSYVRYLFPKVQSLSSTCKYTRGKDIYERFFRVSRSTDKIVGVVLSMAFRQLPYLDEREIDCREKREVERNKVFASMEIRKLAACSLRFMWCRDEIRSQIGFTCEALDDCHVPETHPIRGILSVENVIKTEQQLLPLIPITFHDFHYFPVSAYIKAIFNSKQHNLNCGIKGCSSHYPSHHSITMITGESRPISDEERSYDQHMRDFGIIDTQGSSPNGVKDLPFLPKPDGLSTFNLFCHQPKDILHTAHLRQGERVVILLEKLLGDKSLCDLGKQIHSLKPIVTMKDVRICCNSFIGDIVLGLVRAQIIRENSA
ncbi:hypothetical protein ADUPG1_005913, partial [Aduncisulcus paluster]